NINEFINEFDVHLKNIAYNNNSRKIYLLDGLKTLENGTDRLFLSSNKYPNLYGLNLSNSKETNKLNFKVRSSLRNINLKIEEEIDTERVLYLHLKNPLNFPLPKTN